MHRRGVVEAEPGLYFTGLKYLYSMSSEQIQGTERDSAYVGDAIVRLRTAPIAPHREATHPHFHNAARSEARCP